MQHPRGVCFFVSVVIICSSTIGNNKRAGAAAVYNVLNFGATGTGKTDDTQTFLKAWAATCQDVGATGTPTLSVPPKMTFSVTPLSFNGPCKSRKILFQVLGTIIAPDLLSAWKVCTGNSWLAFTSVYGLIVEGQGSGLFDGRGSVWWTQPQGTPGCTVRPLALLFHNCDNLVLDGLHLMNSPRGHIGINQCDVVTVSNLNIVAPATSPNTDGIDIYASTKVNIHDINIQTGDDCIAINANSNSINITRVTCGPGHGISVGSIGVSNAVETVDQVRVLNCTFIGSTNGARIKTWEGGSGYVRNIFFQQIILVNTGNPIIINQFYTNTVGNGPGIKVSDVTYSDIQGTSATNPAITFSCGKQGCTNIIMDTVQITSYPPGRNLTAFCSNVSGKARLTAPQVPCLA